MAKLVLPRVQAMVLCDGIKESDEENGVFHLNGVRSVLDALSFPALHPRLCAFLQMSGHQGYVQCHVEIECQETGDLVFQSTAKEISFVSPNWVETVFFRLRNCMFPAPGVYYVQVVHDEKLIGERRLLLREVD